MLQLVTKLQWMRSCLLWMKKVFSWDRIFPCEDDVKTIEMTTKNLEQYMYLVKYAVAGFERIDFNFESISTVSKMSSNSIVCYREIVHQRKSQWVYKHVHCCLPFRNLHSLPQILQLPLWSVSSHQHQDRADQKRLWLARGLDDG